MYLRRYINLAQKTFSIAFIGTELMSRQISRDLNREGNFNNHSSIVCKLFSLSKIPWVFLSVIIIEQKPHAKTGRFWIGFLVNPATHLCPEWTKVQYSKYSDSNGQNTIEN
jgi:hypothetical protein